MCFFCKNHLRKSPGLPRAFCSWAREHFVSCARNELSSNFKGSVVAGGSHRGPRLGAPPHGESMALLKYSWNRFLQTRGGNRSPEGASKPWGCVSYRSREAPPAQQKDGGTNGQVLSWEDSAKRSARAGIRPGSGPVPGRIPAPILLTLLVAAERFN